MAETLPYDDVKGKTIPFEALVRPLGLQRIETPGNFI